MAGPRRGSLLPSQVWRAERRPEEWAWGDRRQGDGMGEAEIVASTQGVGRGRGVYRAARGGDSWRGAQPGRAVSQMPK